MVAVEFMLTPNNLNVFARRQSGKTPVKQGDLFAFEGDEPIDFEDADSTLHFFFPKDFAWAVNDSATGFANQTSVRRYFYSDRGKDYMLVGVPWSWINSAPQGTLIIDPTTSVATSADVWIENLANKNSYTILLIGKAAGYNRKRTLIKFNVASSGIPGSATVLNARMKMKYFTAVQTDASPWIDRWVQAHQLLKNWTESEADSARRERSPDTLWTVPFGGLDGADAKATYESTTLFQLNAPQWKYWDVTSLTKYWIDNPTKNFGVILWATNENTVSYDLRLYSSHTSNPDSIRPKLEVIWSQLPRTVYFLKDHLGSIRASVQDTSTAPVVGYDDYDPWGYILPGRSMIAGGWGSQAGIVKNKFTGKEWDDEYNLNWYHFPARSYDPQIGRFLTVDPHASFYPSLTPYNYAGNNPVAFFDPTGMDSARAQQSQPKKESLLEKLGRLARQLLADFGFNPNNLPPTHVDPRDAARRAARAAGGEKATETTNAVVQSQESGTPPTPNPELTLLNKKLASEQQMSEPGAQIAGPGSKAEFRDRQRVAAEHGGNPEDWVKMTSTSYEAADGTKFETHWVENKKTGQRVEQKTKIVRPKQQ
jgi:RHS repeat-associated protein